VSSLIHTLQCDEFPDVVPEFSDVGFYVSGVLHRVHRVHRDDIKVTPDGEFYRYRGLFHPLVSRIES